MDRVADLRADYERLGRILENEVDGAKAASLARERRLIGELLEALEAPQEMTKADELAARRRAETVDPGSASRRRKSG
jgi:hypothetical protein